MGPTPPPPFMEGKNQLGNPGGSSRARRDLNADTIREMHRAFREGGRAAIDKVMKNQPAVFLKLLVLLVPRELEVTHSGGVKSMSDEQIEQAIEAIQEMLAKREAAGAGEDMKLMEGKVEEVQEVEPPPEVETSQVRRKRKRTPDVVVDAQG